MFSSRRTRIAFLCRPEDKGVIAEPYPARAVLPEWFRRLPGIDERHMTATCNGLTVKRCMPFFDALTVGWIIPLAATVRLAIRDGGRTVEAGWEFDREMVSTHAAHQVAGHPNEPRPACKFHNYWSLRTPPGWSCLFLPPLNRPHPAFEALAGIVDTDAYVAPVHFPFFATGADGLHVLEKGTPLVQVIPFRRADAGLSADTRAETPAEAHERERVHRSTLASDGWYRRFVRATRE